MSKESKQRKRERTAQPTIAVGQEFRVPWTNGAGYSVYTIEDLSNASVHSLHLVQDHEYGGTQP